jgi:hypothetical protein
MSNDALRKCNQALREARREIAVLRAELANLRAVKEDESLYDEIVEINAGLLGLGDVEYHDDEW